MWSNDFIVDSPLTIRIPDHTMLGDNFDEWPQYSLHISSIRYKEYNVLMY